MYHIFRVETRVEVWENEKLKWEHEPAWQVFPRYFEFSQTFTSVSITYGNMGNVFYFFYKITRGKLKRGNNLLYQSANSPYRSRWRIMAWTFPCFPYSYRNTAFNQSKLAFYFLIQISHYVYSRLVSPRPRVYNLRVCFLPITRLKRLILTHIKD